MSSPNRGRPEFRVPPGWEKGEPLTVHRVHEGLYQLYRSGAYLQVPGAPITQDTPCLEFPSRVAMVEFQNWWGNSSYRTSTPHFWLTKAEFVEVLQEMFSLNLRDILGNRQGTNTVPAFTMAIQVETEDEQRALADAHAKYIEEVTRILGVPTPGEQVDKGDE